MDVKSFPYRTTTVEEIKAQFQQQIADVIKKRGVTSETVTNVSSKSSEGNVQLFGAFNNNDEDSRKKTFEETRTAVQLQIERIFTDKKDPKMKREIKHSMHGINHCNPDQGKNISPPVPRHIGMEMAIATNKPLLKPTGSVLAEDVDQQIYNIPKLEKENLENSLHSESNSPSVLTSNRNLVRDHTKHQVDYLGALPINHKSTNLSALQYPLKDLYLKYRAMKNLGHHNFPGTLEINNTGLTIQYVREVRKGVQEIFNPFSTIAVWAAVKFVLKKDGSQRHKFSFLPLISDPDSKEKHGLFNHLNLNDVDVALGAKNHPPIFACVMRRVGAPKQLECHGFICKSSEDAIIFAANLYQALLETMKKQKKRGNNIRSSTRKPQGHSSTSRTGDDLPRSDSFSDEEMSSRTTSINFDAQTGPNLSRKKSTNKSSKSVRNRSSAKRGSFRISTDPTKKSHKGIRKTTSTRRKSSPMLNETEKSLSWARMNSSKSFKNTANLPPSGDVYTHVAIPRSKSFMNVSTQYNLQELFKELKEKEGVESIDDVLKKIISPDGISFNDIKPVYKELLLKLAMTMSQDEIFQRSKNILNQEKKTTKKEKKATKNIIAGGQVVRSENSSLGSFLKSKFSTSKSSKKVKDIRQKPLPEIPASMISVMSLGAEMKGKPGGITKADIGNPLPSSKSETYLPKTTISTNKKSEDYGSCTECGYESISAFGSVSDCSCQINSNLLKTKINSSFKRFVEGHQKATGPRVAVTDDFEIYCACESESCLSHEKCYCSLTDPSNNITASTSNSVRTIFETDSTLSASNKTIIKCHGNGTCTVTSTSSENPMQTTRCQDTFPANVKHKIAHSSRSISKGILTDHPSGSDNSACQSDEYCSYYTDQPKHYQHSTDVSGYSSNCNCSSICSIHSTFSNSETKTKEPRRNNPMDAIRLEADLRQLPASEINTLSMKKTAEIAAVFSGADVNQKTNIVSLLEESSSNGSSEYDSAEVAYESKRYCCCSRSSFVNMKSSLGYYP